MKTLLAIFNLFTSVGTTLTTTLPKNQNQNNIQKKENRITTDWIKPENHLNEISYNLPKNAIGIQL